MVRKFTYILIVLFAAIVMSKNVYAKNLKIRNLAIGTGDESVLHSKVTVHYTGWLSNGKKFDSSVDRGSPFDFTLGAGQVISGWDQGVRGMKVGGKRELIIPPKLGYGQRGAGGVIPSNATLRFEIELLAVVGPKYINLDNATLKLLLKKGVKIVDIRRRDERQRTGIIKGSNQITGFDKNKNFNRFFLKEFKKVAKKSEGIILISNLGNRSSRLSYILTEQAGFLKIYNVKQGIIKWISDKNLVVSN